MAKKTYTIRRYVHTDEFKKQLREVEHDLTGMGYIHLPMGDRAPNHSDTYDIYCWRWHGNWTGGCRELFRRYYKPRKEN